MVELFHKFDIQWLQTERIKRGRRGEGVRVRGMEKERGSKLMLDGDSSALPMSTGIDEVETAVHAMVFDVSSV